MKETKYTVKYTTSFKKDYKRAIKRGLKIQLLLSLIHISTNLKLAELKNPPDLAHARIYDRILERCAPILFDGKNFREENAGVTRQAAKDIVNSKHD